MTMKRVLSCLMAVILTVTLICPALGSTVRAAYPSVTDEGGEFQAYHYTWPSGGDVVKTLETTNVTAALSMTGDPVPSYVTGKHTVSFQVKLETPYYYCYNADFRIEITDEKNPSFRRIICAELYTTGNRYTPYAYDTGKITLAENYTDMTLTGASDTSEYPTAVLNIAFLVGACPRRASALCGSVCRQHPAVLL